MENRRVDAINIQIPNISGHIRSGYGLFLSLFHNNPNPILHILYG